MESAIVQAIVAGIVGGVFAGVSAIAAVKVHVYYLREHIKDHNERIKLLENIRHES